MDLKLDLNNIIDFQHLKEKEDKEEDGAWEEFCDNLKTDIFKGAYFIVKNNGKVSFGCTELNKIKQERMLYHLKKTIELYVNNWPDYDELEEFDAMLKKQGKSLDDIEEEYVDIVEED